MYSRCNVCDILSGPCARVFRGMPQDSSATALVVLLALGIKEGTGIIRVVIIPNQPSALCPRRKTESVPLQCISCSHYNHNAPKLIIVIVKAVPIFTLLLSAPFGGILPTPAPPVASAAQLVTPH